MKLTWGCTRWVILTDNYAIKIARFRPLWSLMRLCIGIKEKNVLQTLEERYSRNILLAGIKYVFNGIVANYTEHQIYKKNPSGYDLVPTLFTILWLINIQPRGESVKKTDVTKYRFLNILNSLPGESDISEPKQFCIIGNVVRLADYGSPDAKIIFCE
ncbi:hypothetical protein ACFL05_00140 [Patescibacteria group bacterium]